LLPVGVPRIMSSRTGREANHPTLVCAKRLQYTKTNSWLSSKSEMYDSRWTDSRVIGRDLTVRRSETCHFVHHRQCCALLLKIFNFNCLYRSNGRNCAVCPNRWDVKPGLCLWDPQTGCPTTFSCEIALRISCVWPTEIKRTSESLQLLQQFTDVCWRQSVA
jgi:hypothetical protein